MLALFIVIVLVMFLLLVFGVPVETIEAMVYIGFGAVAVAAWCFVIHEIKKKKAVKRAISVTFIGETPVYKEVAEKTGYTMDWGLFSGGRDHYTYRKVVSHYIYTFSVVLEDGSTKIMRCTKGDELYKVLMKKAKKD